MSSRFAPSWPTITRTALGLALCATVLTACGKSGDDKQATSGSQSSIAFPSTLSTSPPILSATDPAKAAPRWEQVKVMTGNSPQDLGPVRIADSAFQWRIKWNCDAGAMKITSTPPPVPSRPSPVVVEANCPGSGEGFGRQTGEVRINVQASGPWKATLEQQVDTPLDEPPLPDMATAKVLGKGDFYNVDKSGKGTVTLYQLTDGRRALRIEPGFEVLNDPDLVIWVSSLAGPKTAKAMADAPHTELAALRSTRGSQNYIVPDNLPFSDIRSVGLYCVPVPSVYIAATLS